MILLAVLKEQETKEGDNPYKICFLFAVTVFRFTESALYCIIFVQKTEKSFKSELTVASLSCEQTWV